MPGFVQPVIKDVLDSYVDLNAANRRGAWQAD
jgi:hypothetical protein